MGKTPFAGPHKMISCSGCIILLPQGLGNEVLTWKAAETCQQCPPVMPPFVTQCLLSNKKGTIIIFKSQNFFTINLFSCLKIHSIKQFNVNISCCVNYPYLEALKFNISILTVKQQKMFSVFAQPDINTRVVGRIRDGC